MVYPALNERWKQTPWDRNPFDGAFKIIGVVGRGAFGEVHMAREVASGELVALKHIFIHERCKGLPDNVLREVKTLQLLRHPNVIRLNSVWFEGRSLVLCLEYCPLDLASLLRKQSVRLPADVVKALMLQLLRGVHACHSAGALHRDLKPSNILLSRDGQAKLSDFGLSRPADGGERPHYSHMVATRWYRAPELLYGARAYGAGVDIWAAGCIFAEMLGHRPLMAGENDLQQIGRVIAVRGAISEQSWPGCSDLPDFGKVHFPGAAAAPPLQELLPDACPEAVDLLDRMLTLDPQKRCSALDALQHDFFFKPPLPASTIRIRQLVLDTLHGAETVALLS